MIQGYPERASVTPGETLVLHVSTDATRFRVRVARWTDGFRVMHETPWLPGVPAAPSTPDADWEWPAYELDVPRNWPSAVYIAQLQEPDTAAPLSLVDSSSMLFVVRGAGESGLVYKIPLATYHAYNRTGGGCFYINPPRSQSPPGSKVSLHRPGGGIGGEGAHGAADYYDASSTRQTFAHWDARFIRWLVTNGYAPELCTDFDVHADPQLLDRYRLMISVGHDEYWSEVMREGAERFVARGGNVAFFSANVCWWRIHVIDDGTAMVCHQGGPTGKLDQWWPATGVHRPEDSVTGVSYRHGGGWWDGPRRTRGYAVQAPQHWAFAGTGLRAGEYFGSETCPPLVGYECDGAPLDHFDATTGRARLACECARCGTPDGFRMLAASVLDDAWNELPERESYASTSGVHAAVMGIYSRGGTVFTAGTTDWAQVLVSGQEPRVERITRNVVERLVRG